MKTFIISLILIISTSTTIMSQNKLLYFGDPMCSWCYGFSPELEKIKAHFQGELDLELVMGGLRPYNTETMKDLGDFLKHHWEDVAKRSGQAFQYELLDDHSFVYDTEPPCRAVVVMRDIAPDKELPYFVAIQKAFYYDNRNTNDAQLYGELAATFGIDEKEFMEKFNSQEYKDKVRKDFETSAEYGIAGFPSMILQKGEEYFLLSRGYDTAESIIAKVKKVLN